ncbi:MAG: hypothetical protein Q4G47_01905 [Lachnospiraceae bacterium]|nr:hypothetical protein [Lachnospiraceae bacterium]
MNEKYIAYAKTAAPFVLIAAVMIFIAWCPGRRSCQMAVDGKTEEARELYESGVKNSAFQSTVLRFLAPASAKAVYDAYEAGKLDHEDAAGRLDTLAYLETPLGDAQKLREKVESSFRSDDALSKGRMCAEAGDYREAMLVYCTVQENDAAYGEASALADEMGKKYKAEVIASTGSPETEEGFRSASKAISDALDVMPGDGELRAALKVLRNSFASYVKASVIPRIRALTADGHYSEAIQLIDRALVYCDGDMDLKSLRVEAVTLYEEFVSSQTAVYLDNYDSEGAKALIARVREDLPESSVISELEKSISDT